jgi:small-conductance mechanosensitive channel
VVEIRLLRTVLLETGNWITAGHPTGRRVFFPNNFALKGNYFNYSTGGQWMWDELVLGVPAGVNAGAAAQRVQQAMEATLQPELARAREEWEHEPGTVAAKPEPAVHLRPNGAGFDLVVRYITPARQRAETRERTPKQRRRRSEGTGPFGGSGWSPGGGA